MPGPGATKKASKSKPALYDAGFLEEESESFDPNTIRAADKKRGRNTGSKKKGQPNGTEDSDADEVARGLSTSPNGPQSILGQIPYSFPRNNAPADMLDVRSGSVKVSDQYSARTNAWAQDVPYGKSPPVNFGAEDAVEESPPGQGGFMGKGGFNTKTPPRSPAQRKARPVSFGSTIPPVSARQVSEYGYRVTAPSNYGSPPALPHLPQPHFYNAQDINLGLGHQQAKEDISKMFMAFRQLPEMASRPATASRSGVFIGSNGRLDILAVSADGKYEPVGALYGLAGDVIDGVAMSWEAGNDPFGHLRPLVALAVHGPPISPELEASDNESITTGLPNAYNDANQVSQWETRVEVYSLKEQTYITTLLRVPSVSFSPLTHGNFHAQPAGDLKLDAFGNHLIISSGVSGEVFVCGALQSTNEPKIECLAKYWTSVQAQEQRRDSSHSRSPRATINDVYGEFSSHQSAIYCASGRWLAISPPGSSHRPTISAQVTRTQRSRASTSIDSRSPPARPSTSCAVESPDVETLLGTIAREAAQQVVKGASWLGSQGLQVWNGYWNKDQQQPPQSSPPNPAYLYSPRQQPQQGMFPPTHASEPVSREQDIVSIIDLKTMATIATFQPPKGCSFLSFMPKGLGLLTASKKGDVQYVWDLMQVKHVRSIVMISDGMTTETAVPRVRQIAKFERMTPSTIVDVIWEPALGERFALVTKKGTVHLFDLPQTAFRWPPPRRAGKIRPATASSNPRSPTESDAPLSGGFLASAMNIASRAPPMLASLRGRAPSISQGVSGVGATGVGIASATGVMGGRAVAAGLSKSLGAATGTMQNLRHAGDSRLHVESLGMNPAPGMVAFCKRGQKTIISVIDKGSIKSYNLSRAQTRDKNNRLQMTSVFAKKTISCKLPRFSALIANSLVQEPQNKLPTRDEEVQRLSGFWTAEPRRTSATPPRLSHPLSHAEIESNAPYQPFHSDPRVNLFVYSDAPAGLMNDSQLPTASTIFDPPPRARAPATDRWAFGEPISATRLNIRSSPPAHDDGMGSVIYRDTSATTVLEKGEIPEHIVSTTRRKKNKHAGRSTVLPLGEGAEAGEQEGFFEDDMDVLDFAEDRV